MRLAGKYKKFNPMDGFGTLLAATPEEMRGILDNLTNKALQGKIPANAFSDGLFELGEAAVSPNYIGRNIRNTLKNPMARMLVNNPGLAEDMANNMVGQLDSFGVDSRSMKGMIGPGMDLLRQAKKDGLLRSDVSDELVAEELQRPLYSAFQGYIRDNRNNPRINDLIRKTSPGLHGYGTPLELYSNADELGISPEFRTLQGGELKRIR